MGERYLYQKCPFLKDLSLEKREQFEKWMYSDIKALKYESKQMGEYLLEQARNERIFLLMNGTDRLCLLLVHYYEQYQREGMMRVTEGQKRMNVPLSGKF